MPASIAKAGIEYVPVDDYHFKLTGLEEDDLLGYYITEDGGSELCVFPGSEKLRYLIPFRTIEETISYFREIYMRGGNPLLTMADDGEKFGVWPMDFMNFRESIPISGCFRHPHKPSLKQLHRKQRPVL